MLSRRSALILLVAGILGILLFLATRSNEPRSRAPAPEPKAEFVETRREPRADAASPFEASSDRTPVSPLEGEAPATVDENAGWRVCATTEVAWTSDGADVGKAAWCRG